MVQMGRLRGRDSAVVTEGLSVRAGVTAQVLLVLRTLDNVSPCPGQGRGQLSVRARSMAQGAGERNQSM